MEAATSSKNDASSDLRREDKKTLPLPYGARMKQAKELQAGVVVVVL
jgi:hypothetical protein